MDDPAHYLGSTQKLFHSLDWAVFGLMSCDSNNTAAYRNGQLVLDLRPDNKQFNGDLFCVKNMSLSLDDTWVLGGVQCQEKL